MQPIIQTVTGAIDPDELGITMSHEHILIDQWGLGGGYDGILDDEALAIPEVGDYFAAGGRALVECTNVGLRRDAPALKRVSITTGVKVVMGSGWYREPVYPETILSGRVSVDDLAASLTQELTVDVDGTDIRPGIIGEIGTERFEISRANELVFRAAARAHLATDVAIWTHTTHSGELALEQVDLLASEGVPANRIVVSHIGDRFGFRHIAAIAATGVFLSIDNIGYTGPGYPPDAVRADNVLELVAHGHLGQVMLGGDTCTKSALLAYGGKGYGHVIRRFVPLLIQRGLTDDDIDTMLIHNPRRALAFTPKGTGPT